jgi:twitching motility protein PilU
MDIQPMLKVLASQDGSALYLSTGAPPCAKFNGVLKALSAEPLKAGEVAAVADAIMDSAQREEFERELEMNLAISVAGVGRFRINIFKQRNEVSIVARNIKLDIPKFEDLKLPEVLLNTVMKTPYLQAACYTWGCRGEPLRPSSTINAELVECLSRRGREPH